MGTATKDLITDLENDRAELREALGVTLEALETMHSEGWLPTEEADEIIRKDRALLAREE